VGGDAVDVRRRGGHFPAYQANRHRTVGRSKALAKFALLKLAPAGPTLLPFALRNLGRLLFMVDEVSSYVKLI